MFVSLILKGGVMMIPIILGSVVAFAIVLERLWTLWRIRLNLPRFAHKTFDHLQKGQFQKALEHCSRVRHPIGDMFRIGILHRHLSRQEVEAMMEREGDEQIQYLERYMSALIYRSRYWICSSPSRSIIASTSCRLRWRWRIPILNISPMGCLTLEQCSRAF